MGMDRDGDEERWVMSIKSFMDRIMVMDRNRVMDRRERLTAGLGVRLRQNSVHI